MPSTKRGVKTFCVLAGDPTAAKHAPPRLRTARAMNSAEIAYLGSCHLFAHCAIRFPSLGHRREDPRAVVRQALCFFLDIPSTFWPDTGIAGTTSKRHLPSPKLRLRRLTTTEDDTHAHTTLAGRMMHTPLSFLQPNLSWLAATAFARLARGCWIAHCKKRSKILYTSSLKTSLLFTTNFSCFLFFFYCCAGTLVLV
jgi:hypothetical protein